MVLDFSYYETGLPGSFVRGRGCCDFLHSYFVHFLSPVSYLRFLRARPASGKRLLSLPGGGNFDLLANKLGPELRTVWLGHGANCHQTDEGHPFSCDACPNGREKDCWQCLYMLQVELTIKQGEIPVAATTNLFEEGGECVGVEAGVSSEVVGESFQRGLPKGWGQGDFPEEFCGLAGTRRWAKEHLDTGKPLGVGCRWERRYLDWLPQTVYVVATPPAPDGLESSAHAIMVLLQHGMLILLTLMFLLAALHDLLKIPILLNVQTTHILSLALLEAMFLLVVVAYALGCRKGVRVTAICLGTIVPIVIVWLIVCWVLVSLAESLELAMLFSIFTLWLPSLAWKVRKARLGWTAAAEGEGCEAVAAIIALPFCVAEACYWLKSWKWPQGMFQLEGLLGHGIATLIGMYLLKVMVVLLEAAINFECLGVIGCLRAIAQETCCGSCGRYVAPPRQMEPMRKDAKYLSRGYLSRGCHGQEKEALLGSFPVSMTRMCMTSETACLGSMTGHCLGVYSNKGALAL